EAVRERHREARRMCSGDQLLGACLAARLLEPGRERDLLVLDRVTRLEIELTLTALEIASPGRLRLALNRHSQPPLLRIRLAGNNADLATVPAGSRPQTPPGRREGRRSPAPGRASSRRSNSRRGARRAGGGDRARERRPSPP